MRKVRTYSELADFVRAFKTKQIGLLIIVSRAGLGKTSIVGQELESPLILNSVITPLEFYKALARKVSDEKDCLIVIDEAELMFQNSKIKTMLKALCDTQVEKTITYTSSTPLLEDLPKEVVTEAKVIILINTLTPRDAHLKAILNRGHVIRFEPNGNEICNYLSSWAKDKEILNFIKGCQNNNLTLRTYVKALEEKQAGLNWRALVIGDLEIKNKDVVKSIARIKNVTERQAQRIVRQLGLEEIFA